METPTKVSACQGLLAQGSIREEGGEGIFSDRARQRSFVFFFFFLEGEHNEGQLARTYFQYVSRWNRAYEIDRNENSSVSNLLRSAINRVGERDVDRFPSERSSRWRN